MIFEVYRTVSNTIQMDSADLRSALSSKRINKIYRDPKTREVIYYPEIYERIMMKMIETKLWWVN